MNLYITFQDIIEEAKQRTGTRWSMLLDKMANNITNILNENGFYSRSNISDTSDEKSITIHFSPDNVTDHIYASITIIFNNTNEYEDDILIKYHGIQIYKEDSIWTIIRPKYENLIDLVRNISYAIYLTEWKEKHIHIPWAYMIYAKETITNIRNNSHYKVPTFDTWGNSQNYGTEHTLLSFDEFLKSDYLHNYETHAQFPDNWMTEIYQNDVEMNFKKEKLAMEDDEFI